MARTVVNMVASTGHEEGVTLLSHLILGRYTISRERIDLDQAARRACRHDARMRRLHHHRALIQRLTKVLVSWLRPTPHGAVPAIRR